MLVAALTVVLGGCADSEIDELDAISAVIVEAVVTTDDEKFCELLVSQAYVAAVYGGVESCLEARARLPEDEVPPEEVAVTDIEVIGNEATATVEEIGGDTGGAKGTITLVRREDRWQVKELGIEYLRSVFAAGVSTIDFGFDDAKNDELAECFNDRLQKLDDDTFRAVAYASMANDRSDHELVNALIRCTDRVQVPSPEGSEKIMNSKTLIRRQFEQGITAAAIDDGLDRAEVRCLLRELRELVSDEELAEQLDSESEALPRTIARAMARC